MENYATFKSPFYGMSKDIKKVIIEDGVASIGDKAFCYCSALESVTIPGSVIAIGTEAFFQCYALTAVTIPDSVTTIGWFAFFGCKSLTSITIPDSVTFIGDNAFNWCDSLASVTIENPECNIYAEQAIDSIATIYGHDNSTAQVYAETYNRNFVSLDTVSENPTPEILTGDADKDGEFNILDIIILQKWLLGSGDLPNWQAVDFNHDGIINIFDLLLAKKYYLQNT